MLDTTTILLIGFGGGILSFLSPCVLPLVPAYVSYTSGLQTRSFGTSDKAVAPALVLFVLGFSLIFILLGASASIVFPYLLALRSELNWLAGSIIILFGVQMLGGFSWFQRSWEMPFSQNWFGHPAGAFVLGLCFALGWTPCIGPILASVLVLAGQYESLALGVSALTAYAAGLGIPFVAVGYGVARGAVRLPTQYALWAQRFGGLFLLLTGALIITNRLQQLGFDLLKWFPLLGRLG